MAIVSLWGMVMWYKVRCEGGGTGKCVCIDLCSAKYDV